jgi:hypothetical protein
MPIIENNLTTDSNRHKILLTETPSIDHRQNKYFISNKINETNC